jgi:hypothetical protein
MLLACLAVAGCGPFGADVAYLADLEDCRATSTTCAQYVACRARVAQARGRAFAGSCAEDAGQ